ncbi:MAG TPA: signal peptidase I [Chloroflexota bacterium]|nr:signal peptidase I [Chloroflexota bacterium]
MDRDQHVTRQVTGLGTAAQVAVATAPSPAVLRMAAAPDAEFVSGANAPSSQGPAKQRPAPALLVVVNLGLTVFCAVAIATVLALSVGPRFFAYETFIVRSGSMEPAIRTGSIVVVQPVPPLSIRVGDVITYRRPEDPDTTITHRVVEVRPPAGPAAAPVFRTKGDANASVDPWEVQLQGVAWREVFSVPFAGYVFAFTQQPVGRFLFLVIPGLGLAALWLHRQWMTLRRPAQSTTGSGAGAAS